MFYIAVKKVYTCKININVKPKCVGEMIQEYANEAVSVPSSVWSASTCLAVISGAGQSDKGAETASFAYFRNI